MILKEKLRKWQAEAYKAWEKIGKNGLVVASTGSGKTWLAMYCMQETRVSTIIIVPTIVLMNQWKDEILKNLPVSESQIGLYFSEKKEIRPITIAVVNSVRESDLSLFSMCIVDEIHRMGSEENVKPLLKSNFEYSLGITATLERADKKHEVLKQAIGPVVYTYSPQDAKKDKVYNSFNVYNIGVVLAEKEKEEYAVSDRIIKMNSGKFGGFGEMISASKNPRSERGRTALALLKHISRRRKLYCNAEQKIPKAMQIVANNEGQRIIIFAEYIAPANEMYKALKKKGYKAGIYHSKNKTQEPLQDFANGKINILVSVKSLNEGLDIEDATVGIILSSNQVDRNTIQRLGRIVRYKEGKEAKLYQVYCKDTVEQEQAQKRMKILSPICEKCEWV